jgi:hypothetical protein
VTREVGSTRQFVSQESPGPPNAQVSACQDGPGNSSDGGFEGSAYSRRHDVVLGAVKRALCDAVNCAGPGGYPRRTARLGQWHNPEADCLPCEQAKEMTEKGAKLSVSTGRARGGKIGVPELVIVRWRSEPAITASRHAKRVACALCSLPAARGTHRPKSRKPRWAAPHHSIGSIQTQTTCNEARIFWRSSQFERGSPRYLIYF